MVPGVVMALNTPGGGGQNTPVGGNGTQNTPGGGGQNTPVGGGNTNTSNPNKITWKIINPLNVGSDVSAIITAVMKNIIMPLASVLVVLAVLYSGFKFVIAQGNPKELEEARTGFIWVLIGSAVLLGAYGITEVLKTTIEQIAPIK